MAVVVGLQAPIFPSLVGGKNFNGKLKKVGLKKIRLCAWSDPYS
jgi:hypothetical protein